MSIVSYAKYPFLVRLDDFLREYYGSLTLEEIILANRSASYIKRALMRIVASLKNEIYVEGSSPTDEVLSFYMALLISSLISPSLAKRLAVYESKRVYDKLMRESDEALVSIGRRLGLDLKYLGSCVNTIVTGYSLRDLSPIEVCLDYQISIPDYLTYGKRLFSDPAWKLTNQVVKGGYVYIDKRKVARLLSEVVYQKIVSLIPRKLEGLPKELKEFIDYVKSEISREVPDFDKSFITTREPQVMIEAMHQEAESILIGKELVISSEKELQKVIPLMPPCIKEILNQLMRSENLSHHQRFALATFLINIGVDLDLILEIFSKAPDFNERIARYQIEHLAGLRGSRKKYLPYSCATMRSLGMCVSECGTKSPLTYFYKELRKLKKGKSKEKVKSS